jgi:hypothetical protein
MTEADSSSQGGAQRGRPVMKLVDREPEHAMLVKMIQSGSLWFFCGEHEGRDSEAVDAAHAKLGPGIYQSFDRGSWGRGHWRA